jgi:class 3 adenylate cyclase
VPAASSLASQGEPDGERSSGSRPFGVFSFELRRYMRPATRISSEIEGRVVNRCVLAALEVLTDAGADIDLAGTAVRPVIEARFDGDEGPMRAARTALAVVDAIRRVQRARENEFQVIGALAAGTSVRGEGGVLIRTGPTETTLERLREEATPGQILLSPEAREACEGLVETTRAERREGVRSGKEPDAFVLRGLRD